MSGITQALCGSYKPTLHLANTVSASGTSALTSWAITVNLDVYLGDRILVVMAMDNSGTNGASAFSSLIAGGGSTATITLEGGVGTALNDPGAANAGVDLMCRLYNCTAGLITTLAVFFSTAVPSKAAYVFILRGIPGTSTAAITGFVSSNGVATTSATSPTLSTNMNDLVFGAGAVEARTGITSDASAEWTTNPGAIVADTGTAETSMVLVVQGYKETSTNTRDYTITANAARDMIAAIFSIRAT